jgi:hypothetical protein
MNFLRLAEAAGWHTVFLGPATSKSTFIPSAGSYREYVAQSRLYATGCHVQVIVAKTETFVCQPEFMTD